MNCTPSLGTFKYAEPGTLSEEYNFTPAFVEEVVMSGAEKPNTNDGCSIQTCPDVTIIYMPCYNYSIKLSDWICKI